MKILGGRRWKRRCRRRCGASVVPWLGGEVEDVVTELSSTLDGRGRAGGHGYGDEDGELRSVVCAGGKQRRERGPGEEREGWTAPGGCVASPRMDRLEGGGLQREAGGGRRRRAPRLASARPPGRGGRGQRRRRWAGPAGGTGPALVAARVRPGKWPRWPLSPLFLFCFIFFKHCFLFVSICFDLVQTLNHFYFFQ